MSTTRRIDILIWGASGYTGSWGAEYLARNYPPSKATFKWAIAGRNLSKLEEIKKLIVGIDASCKQVEVLTADTGVEKSLDDLLSQTKIVVSFAGPFVYCGTPIIESCIRVGTHYCDITGEVTWIKKVILASHQAAVDKKVILIPCCGFDSVPSDIGTFIMHDYAKKKLNDEVHSITIFFSAKGSTGSFAGGTARSMMAIFDETSFEERKQTSDINYLLNHGQIPFKDAHSDFAFWKYNKTFKSYQTINPMVVVNKKIVLRSASLLKYGSSFTYNDYLKIGNSFVSFLFSLSLLFFTLVVQVPFIRSLINKMLPESGVGPDRVKVTKASFRVDIKAVTVKQKRTLTGYIQSEMDPAYGETSKMSIESAICLLHDHESLISAGKTGFQTPASALGEHLVDRLKKAKMEIHIN